MTALASVFAESRRLLAPPRTWTISEYLEACRSDKGLYAPAAQRLLKAIGEPEIVDTSGDRRLGRLFDNRKIKRYKAFDGFYGIEDVIEQLVGTLKDAALGLEPSRQILYLLGPVGSAKSTLASRLKQLMEKEPMYVLAVRDPKRNDKFNLSPIFESPLGIFPASSAEALGKEFGIPPRHFDGMCSPWASKRLEEFEGEISQFHVVEVYPSFRRGIGVAEVAPGDENNQDISDLVGKIDVRMLETYASHDADAYSCAGGLCIASHGILDFVEMFKAPVKTLHPLLTATADRHFKGSESNLTFPFRGVIIAHSNESEWQKFKSNKNNEAFLDRVCLIEVPYNLRLTEEMMIYNKILGNSEIGNIPIAPDSLELLARTVIASRLAVDNSAKHHHKVLIYDGKDLRGEVPNAPTLHDLRKGAKKTNAHEGFWGVSSRTAFKVLGNAANFAVDLSIDPVAMYEVMKRNPDIMGLDGTPAFIESTVDTWLMTNIGNRIREALLENHASFSQETFNRYFLYADMYRNRDLGAIPDPDTGIMLTKEDVGKRLRELEESAGISNPDGFRQNFVEWVLRYKAAHNNSMPPWDSNAEMERAIKQLVIKKTEDSLHLISFAPQKDAEDGKKHHDFVKRMKTHGYTTEMVRRIVTWYQQRRAKS